MAATSFTADPPLNGRGDPRGPDEMVADPEPALLPRRELGAVPAPARFLIEQILPASERGMCGMLTAPEGSLKTFLGLDWSCCIASMVDWMDRAVDPGPVVYVLAEGQDELLKRIVAWERRHQASADSLYVQQEPVDLTDRGGMERFRDKIRRVLPEGEPPKLIVFDTISQNLGVGDDVDGKTVRTVLRHLRLLTAAFGCTVLLLHHPAKGSTVYRGHGTWRMDTDFEFVLRYEEQKGYAVLKCQRLKSKKWAPLALTVEEVLVAGEPTLVFTDAGPFTEGRVGNPNAEQEAFRVVAEALIANPALRTMELLDVAGLDKEAWNGWRRDWLKAEWLVEIGRGRYQVTPSGLARLADLLGTPSSPDEEEDPFPLD